MGNRKIHQKIESLQKVIDSHKEKIAEEIQNSYPDTGVIHHWEAEISAHKERINRLKRRLGK